MNFQKSEKLRFGLYLPNYGKVAYARTLAELALESEDAGWDGVFLWDHVMYSEPQHSPMVDSLTTLAAIAVKTKRIRLGTTVTPLARRRPWIVARQTVTLDHLSNGRLTLGVGLGNPAYADFQMFGESGDEKNRAEKLDEGLEILTGLWTGKQFSYTGKHYAIEKARFLPATKQKPRIPIWVGGFWPNKAPFRRAAKYDGVIPLRLASPIEPEPRDLRNILAYIKKRRKATGPFDAAVIGWGTRKSHTENTRKIQTFAEAGMTWWLESLFLQRNSLKEMKKSIRKGPPTIS
ncbi:MAG: LLM class flavin-dependent oxidoreductase [Candidatus Bathyarchaeia archaeon]